MFIVNSRGPGDTKKAKTAKSGNPRAEALLDGPKGSQHSPLEQQFVDTIQSWTVGQTWILRTLGYYRTDLKNVVHFKKKVHDQGPILKNFLHLRAV